MQRTFYTDDTGFIEKNRGICLVVLPQLAAFTAVNQTAHVCPVGLNDETTDVPSVKLLGNLLQIETPGSAQRILLTDLTGRFLKEERLTPFAASAIDVSGIHGIFCVTVQTAVGSTTQRFFR